MANVNRPNGFRFVKTFSGAPVTGLIKVIGVADGADIFVGDPINLESGLAAPGATADTDILGVAIGFGKFAADGKTPSGPFNPDSLTTRYYDDSASTHTEWCCFYISADDAVFEAQTATALTLVPGSTCDLSYTAGSTTTGISACEITTSSNAELTVVEVPVLADNTPTLIYGRYYVMITRAKQAFHA